jgi:hypothetical protein
MPMTEQQWLASTAPTEMVNFLRGKRNRKLRLFFCASCRCVWHLLDSKFFRHAVEVGERFADGLADEQERETVQNALSPEAPYFNGTNEAAAAFGAVSTSFPVWSLEAAVKLAIAQVVNEAVKQGKSSIAGNSKSRIRQQQVCLLRCITGNPFRPIAVNPALLAWNSGTVPKIAQAIYDERAFERLPVLADALEEAGCTEADILSHCRSDGPHGRGCWVVDLLVGNE